MSVTFHISALALYVEVTSMPEVGTFGGLRKSIIYDTRRSLMTDYGSNMGS